METADLSLRGCLARTWKTPSLTFRSLLQRHWNGMSLGRACLVFMVLVDFTRKAKEIGGPSSTPVSYASSLSYPKRWVRVNG